MTKVNMSDRRRIKDILLDFVTQHFIKVVGKYPIDPKLVNIYGLDKLKEDVKHKAAFEGMKHITVDHRKVLGITQFITEYYIVDHEKLIGFINDIANSIVRNDESK